MDDNKLITEFVLNVEELVRRGILDKAVARLDYEIYSFVDQSVGKVEKTWDKEFQP